MLRFKRSGKRIRERHRTKEDKNVSKVQMANDKWIKKIIMNMANVERRLASGDRRCVRQRQTRETRFFLYRVMNVLPPIWKTRE